MRPRAAGAARRTRRSGRTRLPTRMPSWCRSWGAWRRGAPRPPRSRHRHAAPSAAPRSRSTARAPTTASRARTRRWRSGSLRSSPPSPSPSPAWPSTTTSTRATCTTCRGRRWAPLRSHERPRPAPSEGRQARRGGSRPHGTAGRRRSGASGRAHWRPHCRTRHSPRERTRIAPRRRRGGGAPFRAAPRRPRMRAGRRWRRLVRCESVRRGESLGVTRVWVICGLRTRPACRRTRRDGFRRNTGHSITLHEQTQTISPLADDRPPCCCWLSPHQVVAATVVAALRAAAV